MIGWGEVYNSWYIYFLACLPFQFLALSPLDLLAFFLAFLGGFSAPLTARSPSMMRFSQGRFTPLLLLLSTHLVTRISRFARLDPARFNASCTEAGDWQMINRTKERLPQKARSQSPSRDCSACRGSPGLRRPSRTFQSVAKCPPPRHPREGCR